MSADFGRLVLDAELRPPLADAPPLAVRPRKKKYRGLRSTLERIREGSRKENTLA